MRAPDLFGTLLAAGLTTQLALYAFVNMGVATGLLPTTGLPLPFVSYGGSALVMNLAATLFRMTVDECLIGVTRAAAQALGMADRIGTLEAGKQCDLAIWNVERPAELVYRLGMNPLHERVWRGQ